MGLIFHSVIVNKDFLPVSKQLCDLGIRVDCLFLFCEERFEVVHSKILNRGFSGSCVFELESIFL